MKPKYTSAFSLLEIIVSMLILSLVVAGTFGLFVTSSKFIIEAQHRLQAVNYARMVAEHLRVYVSASNTPPAPGTAGTGDGCVLQNGAHLNPHTELGIPNVTTLLTGVTNQDCDYTVDDNVVVNALSGGVAIGGNTDIEEVTITVSWTEP